MQISKPELSAIELKAIVTELQILVGARINQIFQIKNEFFIQLHKKEKFLLRIEPGKLIYLTKHKPEMEEPSSFCMQLRKHLNGQTILAVEQINAQRIVKISFKQHALYVELFSKGNIILVDDKNTIIAILQRQSWQSRDLKPHIAYQLPPMETDMFSIDNSLFHTILSKSKKDKIVSCLAAELGLGSLYAELLCSNIDKNKSPKQFTADEKSRLYSFFSLLREKVKTEPKGYIYDDNTVSPIKIPNKNLIEELSAFDEALDKTLSLTKSERLQSEKELLYQQKINELTRILEQQEKTLSELTKKIEEESAKGEIIYHNYQQIKELLDQIKKIKVIGGWSAVNEFLSTKKEIKNINLKDKSVKIEIK